MIELNSQYVQDFVALVIFTGSVLVYRNGRIPQQTIKNLEDSNKSYIELDKARQAAIDALEKKVQDVTDKHTAERLELNKAISTLEGQIQVYKELPLRELADGIKEVVIISRDNATSNKAILNQLQSTAGIAAEDREVLTNQDLHIKTKVHKIMDQGIPGIKA